MDQVNQRLKALRIASKATQKEFAELLGVKRSYYSEVESLKRPVSINIITQLIDKHNVEPNWLFKGEGKMMSDNSPGISRANSPINDRLNSLKHDTEFVGQNVGLAVGFEEKKRILEMASRRFRDELERDHPELKELSDEAFKVIDFELFLRKFSKKYLDQILFGINDEKSPFDGNELNYSLYRQNRLERLKKMEHLKPALANLGKAIMQFYKEFAPFDKENIIKDHFWNYEAEDN